jgi:hypothetical protein
MLKFIANLFGTKHKAPTAPAPYKVDVPNPVTEQASQAVVKSIAPAKKPARVAKPKAEGTKPAVKAKTARKPKAPKA